MPGAPTFRRGDVIAKRYQVVTKSGETSLWVGYHGFDRNNLPSGEQRGIPEPDVLIKIVRPDLLLEQAARSHVSRELQRVKGLQHPGMPRLHDLQPLEDLGTVVLIEPMQAGLSQGVLLRRMVTFRQNERFTLAEVRQISAQIASALSYVHGQMMCHGDLRLESVILRPDGAKLCDIGLGAALPRGPYLDAVRRAGESELLAPEVRAGKQPDPRSDVFGLASLYKHLISLGQPAAWDAFLNEKPAMGLVLMRGMADDPAQRYSSIEALIADVEAVALTGAPIRKRLAQTPLAMAVAAGRLPAEELNRPVEEIVDGQRQRRSSGGFEVVNAVLAPMSGGPAAKMSIGTIPPNLASQASTRSGRLVAAESGEFKAASSSSSSGKSGPFAASSGSSSNASTGSSRSDVLASSMSVNTRITMPGRVRFQVTGEGEKPAEGAEGKEAAAAAAPPTSTGSGGSRASVGEDGAPKAALPPDPTVPYRSGSKASSPEASRGSGGGAAEAAARDKAAPTPDEKAAAAGGSPAPAADAPAAAPAATPAARTPSASPRDDSGSQKTPRAHRSESSGPRGSDSSRPPRISRTSPAPSEVSARPDRASGSQASVPPLPAGMVVTSRKALLGSLVLAAVVGALVAVVVTLLLRPAAAPPAPYPVVPIAPPSYAPGAPPAAAPPAQLAPQLPRIQPMPDVEPPPAPLAKPDG
jgi:serine/threonine protein kinase